MHLDPALSAEREIQSSPDASPSDEVFMNSLRSFFVIHII